MDDGARIPPTGLHREKRQRSKRKMASMFFRWLPLLATACGFRVACAIPCEVGSLPSYDSTFCMGHYPHLYFFNNTYIETCPAGYFHRQKHAPTIVRFPHTAHELFFGKRCEQEKVGVIEAWGTQAQNEPGATYKIKSIYATSVGVAGIIDDGLNSVLTWGNHYGDVPTYLRGIKTMYTNFENYAAVTHNGVLYNCCDDGVHFYNRHIELLQASKESHRFLVGATIVFSHDFQIHKRYDITWFR